LNIPQKILYKSDADDLIEYLFVEITLKFLKLWLVSSRTVPNRNIQGETHSKDCGKV
jgi:hypothetical protein